jgi:hypothetical protein
MGLCIVSQRPAKVDKNIISQCNTNIILKVTNPNDLKTIVQSVEGLTSQTFGEIQRLPIGVALISGASLQMPIMTEIRTRETSHGGQSVKISKGGHKSNYEPSIKKQYNTEYIEPTLIKEKPETPLQKPKNNVTEKAKNVTRVANRLGWINVDDPDEAIKILTKEAEKMNENVYKYLESLANLGNNFCYNDSPNCIKCPMKDGCNYRKQNGSIIKKGLFRKK